MKNSYCANIQNLSIQMIRFSKFSIMKVYLHFILYLIIREVPKKYVSLQLTSLMATLLFIEFT